ncbi:MAG TPA: M20/M25/M40 family metallo-hydrolase [Terriglobales bacterium]|nr:M20/M25/M40 family metallo-hydrolase [Terriglobales bacterium]
MDPLRLTRELVDIESTTGREADVGNFLLARLASLGWEARAMAVEEGRFNVHATLPGPAPVTYFSTHMDTVPPFIPSSEDDQRIYGRGSCDAKGIIAAQIAAAERLRARNIPVGLLFVVGEERDSLGAMVANRQPTGAKFLVNGEPTENRLALASKGALRVELVAEGRMAHSAYPDLGESAIEKLIRALNRLLEMPLPADPEIGSTTMNIGVIEGGRAPNVIADRARAQLLYRLVGPAQELKRQIEAAVAGLATANFVLEIPFVRLRALDGLPTMIASFTTDIPALSAWGTPLLVGPGSILVAHTEREHIEKRQLLAAVDLYCEVALRLR